MNNLALLLQQRGVYNGLYLFILIFFEDWEFRLNWYFFFADSEAKTLLEIVLVEREKTLGSNHSSTADTAYQVKYVYAISIQMKHISNSGIY